MIQVESLAVQVLRQAVAPTCGDCREALNQAIRTGHAVMPGLSHRQLAAALGTNQSRVHRVLHGQSTGYNWGGARPNTGRRYVTGHGG
jgi:hypothetical protein